MNETSSFPSAAGVAAGRSFNRAVLNSMRNAESFDIHPSAFGERMNRHHRRRWGSWSVPIVIGLIIAFQLAVAIISIDLLAAVRTYVSGESLYSKAQKAAQGFLLDYAASQQEVDYQRFVQALAVPVGDRIAREELNKPDPDFELVRRSFEAGGNHPDDIGGAIRLYRLFHNVPFMADAISTWRDADAGVAEMQALVERARARVGSTDAAEAFRALRAQAPGLNVHLTELEQSFSNRLGDASRWTQNFLVGVNVAIAALLALTGFGLIRRSARILQQGELQMTRLVDAVTDGVLIIDANGKIVLCNRAAAHVFGVATADAIGALVDRFIPHCLETARRARQQAIGDSGALHNLIGRRADGREFPMEASLSKIDTASGTLVTMVFRDVTEARAAHAERQTREALEATSQAKTEFLSRMSHELRTPLNAVLGFSQLLRLDTDWPPSVQQLERIQHIENAGAHLLALVNDVLDLSRVESGQMRLVLGVVSLRLVIEDALTMVRNLASAAGVECVASRIGSVAPADMAPRSLPSRGGADPLDVWVLADPVRLRQVLVNLLTNGIKYNRSGGSVRVSCGFRGNAVQVMIADTGPGIPSDKLSHLFEPFNRLGAENSKIEGTGIGLVLSRRLVELMRGELTVASTVGRGTVATLVLQACDEPFAAPLVQTPPSQHGMLDASLNVLYAEDNEVNVELVRGVVRLRPAITMRVAENGRQAVEMARSAPPDLMLVDMNLGDMTGMELAQELRCHAANRSIRLVALSADAMPEQIAAALAFGFECYLTKPIDFRKLLNVLDGQPDS